MKEKARGGTPDRGYVPAGMGKTKTKATVAGGAVLFGLGKHARRLIIGNSRWALRSLLVQ